MRLDLISDGGNVGAAMEVVRSIRQHTELTVNAEVPKGALCASACAMVFSAIPHRRLGRTSQLMFHAVDVYGAFQPRFGHENDLNSEAAFWGLYRLIDAAFGWTARDLQEINPDVADHFSRRGLLDHLWYQYSPCLLMTGDQAAQLTAETGLDVELTDAGETTVVPAPTFDDLDESCRKAPTRITLRGRPLGIQQVRNASSS